MRLKKPDTISGAVSYEQRYAVSSYASEEPIDDESCSDGCTSDCDGGGQCVQLTDDVFTRRMIKCPADEQ